MILFALRKLAVSGDDTAISEEENANNKNLTKKCQLVAAFPDSRLKSLITPELYSHCAFSR